MTQVQAMTNNQLNFSLYQLLPGNKVDHAEQIPHYCTDAAASLEVQTAAIKVNSEEYMRNLGITKWKEDALTSWSYFTLDKAAELLTASPRERAEAAYITLQQVRE